MNLIEKEINKLKADHAVNVKRGYDINHINLGLQTNHLIEESAELQSEVLAQLDHRTWDDKVLKEAAHVYCVFVHLMIKLGFSMEEVEFAALSELQNNWTTRPENITAKNPGFTRAGRADSHGGSASPGDISIRITPEMAAIILGALSVCEAESMSGLPLNYLDLPTRTKHAMALAKQLKEQFPLVAEQFKDLWLFKDL